MASTDCGVSHGKPMTKWTSVGRPMRAASATTRRTSAGSWRLPIGPARSAADADSADTDSSEQRSFMRAIAEAASRSARSPFGNS